MRNALIAITILCSLACVDRGKYEADLQLAEADCSRRIAELTVSHERLRNSMIREHVDDIRKAGDWLSECEEKLAQCESVEPDADDTTTNQPHEFKWHPNDYAPGPMPAPAFGLQTYAAPLHRFFDQQGYRVEVELDSPRMVCTITPQWCHEIEDDAEVPPGYYEPGLEFMTGHSTRWDM